MMERIAITARKDWETIVEGLGYDFYKAEDHRFWHESAYYKFTADEVDEIEAAANKLEELCIQAVDRIVSQRLFPILGIPADVAAAITESWRIKSPSIYGRFDLMYDGKSPPKMLEYNADTPTALFEASVVQWHWKEQRFPEADQFNSIHEALVAHWRALRVGRRNADRLHITCATPMPEDETTVQYIGQAAKEAGYKVKFLPIQELGWDEGAKAYCDLDNMPISLLFKLYPWEWIVREPFGKNVTASGAMFIEPIWKMLLSNKGILPILWEMFPEHPNLLPAYRTSTPFGNEPYVRKAALGREGANIRIVADGKVLADTPGEYADSGYIFQGYAAPPVFDGNHPNLGVWMINGGAHGMGLREDAGLVVSNTSRIVPHIFV